MAWYSLCLSPAIGGVIGAACIMDVLRYQYPQDMSWSDGFMFSSHILLKYLLILVVISLIITALLTIYYKIKKDNSFEILECFFSCCMGMAVGAFLVGAVYGYHLTANYQYLPNQTKEFINSTPISLIQTLFSMR